LRTMLAILQSLGMCIIVLFKSRRRIEAENLFLRHQLSIALRRAPPRLRLRGSDRALLVWMTRLWPSLLGCGPGASTGDDGFPAPLDIGREAADRGRELRHRGGCRRRRGGMGCLRASCSRGAVWPERGGRPDRTPMSASRGKCSQPALLRAGVAERLIAVVCAF
jgi:hypothetical protein